MEVSSHALDQHRVDGTRFAVVVGFTISRVIISTTTEMKIPTLRQRQLDLEFAPTAAINVDDPRGAALAARAVERD